MRKIQLIIAIVSSILLITLGACSKDSENVPDEPKQVNGDVIYSISTNKGTGKGTADDPAVATASEDVDMTLSQKSSYEDPNGTIYTCEPEATINLTVKEETVYAKTLSELLSIKESSSINIAGTNPVAKQTLQTFTMGGQTVTFDLRHEIYTYVNSKKQSVEMPYLKLNAAKHGVATSQETRAMGFDKIVVTGIRLTPIDNPSTRGIVTSQQAYQVSVAFHLDVESEHAEKPNKQTLSFEVNYEGVVETTTEYPDPTTALTIYADAVSGTSSTKTPYVKDVDNDDMKITWSQQSTYTYFSVSEMETKVVSFEPEANVIIALSSDTVYSMSIDSLQKVNVGAKQILNEEKTSVVQYSQSFNIGGQRLLIKWNYDVLSPVSVNGNTVEMPYVKLEEPELIGVTSKEIPDALLNDMEGKVYEMTVFLRQRMKHINVMPPNEQTIEYTIKYIGVQEIKLAKVAYRKDYQWYPAHDNISEQWQYIIYRDRTYSTGETFTDNYMSMNTSIESRGTGFDPNPYNFKDEVILTLNDTTKVYLHKRTFTYDDMGHEYGSRGAHWIRETSKTGVPDLSKLYKQQMRPCCFDTKYGNLSAYKAFDGPFFDAKHPLDEWYFIDCGIDGSIYVVYGDGSPDDYIIRTYKLNMTFYDKCRSIDGHTFDFMEYAPIYDVDFQEENITMPNGAPAKVHTYRLTAKFLGKDYDYAVIDTIYQFSPKELKELGMKYE